MKIKKLIKISIISFVSLVLVFSIVSFLVSKSLYDKQFPHFERPDVTIHGGIIDYNTISLDYPRTNVSFDSNGNQLAGYIYGENNDKGLIVVAHGLGGGADSYLPEITYFLDQGYRVFAYDCTGSYDSEGESTKGFPQSIIDLDHALTYVEGNSEFNGLPILLFGHSWGGYAVANVLNYDHNITAVVSVSGVNNSIDFIGNQGVDMLGWFGNLEKPFISLYQYLLFKDVCNFSAVDGINKANIPTLIIHGDVDDTVSYDRDSIISHQDEITNPYVEYITTTGVHGGHTNLFRSSEALTYIDSINEDYRDLYDSFDGEIPYGDKQAFYAILDDELISDVNEDLMDQIITFFDNSITNE